MCGGLQYNMVDAQTRKPLTRKVYFPIPHAQVPVMQDDGAVELVQWGRRKGEDAEYDVPVTGWARLASLAAGKWNHYRPRRVRIPALCWMEKDPSGASHWFDMMPETCLLGVQIQCRGKGFVYVVTRPAGADFRHVHPRMPMIVPVTSLVTGAGDGEVMAGL